ncbi:MAG: rhodanese-like domain-containing protein [Eudoraea sp.]|nr:rhodanese-like domain-containing protein [Eudoraea sp.]NNK30978.1 rhodanese-like domain-containing protein [Flavobacteriaceae bacterium]
MRFWIFLVPLLLISCLGQRSIDGVLDMHNQETVPYIKVPELVKSEGYALLDTRKREEYEVSHLKNAHWVGNDQFNLEEVTALFPNKDTAIVVYCSIGVRSEDIGEKLQDAGYTNVKNLYGGIFEWKNKGYPVLDPRGNKTEKVHAYNTYWGRLLTNADKVYSP